jgi:hypothetical protein
MIELNDEFQYWFDMFYEKFNDIIPLRQIPSRVTNEELFDAVKKSIEAEENLLPEIFGYKDVNPHRIF